MKPEKLPSPGMALVKRAAIAAVLTILMTAGAVSAAVILQVDELATIIEDEAGGRIDIKTKEITPAEAGKPQTIMILGTDKRLGNDPLAGDDARSDTIILARLDARKEAITLMSIPRDLKATIAGKQYADRINSAFALGGANLTLKTVKDLLSTPERPFEINHVVEVSFTGFRRMVDFLGCAYTDVDQDYFNDRAGVYAVIDIDPGYQKICGEDALAYVRYRHTDNDLIRGARQQDFIRQMLRQKGVRKRLNFSRRKDLARIAGRYTRTDKSLRETKQIFSLLRLGLAVSDKPIQEVPFGLGRLQEEGLYLTASPDALKDTVDDFLNAKGLSTARSVPKPSKADRKLNRERRKSKTNKASSVAGLEIAQTEGENQAIIGKPQVDFPFYFPRLRVTGARYYPEPRAYTLKDELGKKHRAYRMVAHLGAPGEYYGIQGMSWRRPPILDGPHRDRVVNGRKLMVYYDGRRVRLVAWRTDKAVYYVHNTLARTVDASKLIAIAGSLRRLGQ